MESKSENEFKSRQILSLSHVLRRIEWLTFEIKRMNFLSKNADKGLLAFFYFSGIPKQLLLTIETFENERG